MYSALFTLAAKYGSKILIGLASFLLLAGLYFYWKNSIYNEGYDKAAAALAGAVIEGYKLANHCGYVEAAGEKKREALLKAYKRRVKAGEMSREEHAAYEKKAAKLGCRFANWNSPAVGLPNSWGSLHNESGLGRLEMLGFRVITAL